MVRIGNTYNCYLLRSLSPRHPHSTYIGFTTDPRNRIRQHNGEIASGARKTHAARPWEMIAVVTGFRSQIEALQFEWAWQHPRKSKAARAVTAGLWSKRGAKAMISILGAMLSVAPWSAWPLAVHVTAADVQTYVKGQPPVLPPAHTATLTHGPLSDLRMYVEAAAYLELVKEAKADARAAKAAANRGKGRRGGKAAAPPQPTADAASEEEGGEDEEGGAGAGAGRRPAAKRRRRQSQSSSSSSSSGEEAEKSFGEGPRAPHVGRRAAAVASLSASVVLLDEEEEEGEGEGDLDFGEGDSGGWAGDNGDLWEDYGPAEVVILEEGDAGYKAPPEALSPRPSAVAALGASGGGARAGTPTAPVASPVWLDDCIELSDDDEEGAGAGGGVGGSDGDSVVDLTFDGEEKEGDDEGSLLSLEGEGEEEAEELVLLLPPHGRPSLGRSSSRSHPRPSPLLPPSAFQATPAPRFPMSATASAGAGAGAGAVAGAGASAAPSAPRGGGGFTVDLGSDDEEEGGVPLLPLRERLARLARAAGEAAPALGLKTPAAARGLAAAGEGRAAPPTMRLLIRSSRRPGGGSSAERPPEAKDLARRRGGPCRLPRPPGA